MHFLGVPAQGIFPFSGHFARRRVVASIFCSSLAKGCRLHRSRKFYNNMRSCTYRTDS